MVFSLLSPWSQEKPGLAMWRGPSKVHGRLECTKVHVECAMVVSSLKYRWTAGEHLRLARGGVGVILSTATNWRRWGV